MPTLEEKNTAIASVTASLRGVENKADDIQGAISNLRRLVLVGARTMEFSRSKQAHLKGCVRRITASAATLSQCLAELHENAEAMAREEMELDGGIVIQPLGGGGSKPPPDDELPDDPPPPPPGGG